MERLTIYTALNQAAGETFKSLEGIIVIRAI